MFSTVGIASLLTGKSVLLYLFFMSRQEGLGGFRDIPLGNKATAARVQTRGGASAWSGHMSTPRLAVLCLAAAAATLLVCYGQARKLPPIPPPVPLGHTSPEAYTGPGAYTEVACSEEVLEAARMYYAEELMVYRTTKRPRTREDVLAMARHLGVEGSPEARSRVPEKQEGSGLFGGTFPPWQIELADDGRYHLTDRTVEVNRDRTGPPISNARVRAIADAFLQRTGLLPKGSEFRDVTVGDTIYGNLPDGRPFMTVLELRARYTQYLNGLPWEDLTVDVTAGGEVSGVRGRLPEVTPAGRYPIITPEEALASFRAGEVQTMGPGGRVPERWSGVRYRAEVESMYLAYTGVAPYTDTVSYLHPVYLIQAKVYDGERLLPDRLTGWVPAVKWEYLDARLLDAPYR
jgi:hypothetical protein